MPLESLDREQFNIRDLTLDTEKKKPTSSQEILRKLRSTDAWDERGYWRYSINEGGNIEDKYIMTGDQFLYIAARAQTNKNEAIRLYGELSTGPLYNSEEKYWYWGMDINSPEPEGDIQLADQIMELYSLSFINPEVVPEKFRELQDNFYKPDRKLWLEDDNPPQRTYPSDQLRYILVESRFDPKSAKKHYEELKTVLFDQEENKWFTRIREDKFGGMFGEEQDFNQISETYLLDILIKASFDRFQAAKDYQELKKSSLYNASAKMWRSNVLADGRKSDSYYLGNQFLGVICEEMFANEEFEEKTTPPSPEIRSY